MVLATNLGFPRIGNRRELKKAVEAYWAGTIDEGELLGRAQKLRATHWKLQKKAGLDHIPSGDFSLYDHVLDTAVTVGAIPQRYQGLAQGAESENLEMYFAMGRGLQRPATDNTAAVDVPAMEMKKWFDTNYHFIVPEISPSQEFSLGKHVKFVEQFVEAAEMGIKTRPVILGPVSFLLLSKPTKDNPDFHPITLLEKLLPVYASLLRRLSDAGAEWVQFDEPCLALDQPPAMRGSFQTAYSSLGMVSPKLKLLIATYFDSVEPNLDFLNGLPIAALHVDVVRAPQQLEAVMEHLGSDRILSIGIVDGRNVWKSDLAASLELARRAVDRLGADRLWIAPSCSLLHSPHSLATEKHMTPEILNWLAFSVQKLDEVATIAHVLNGVSTSAVAKKLADNASAIQARRTSPLIHNAKIQERINSLQPAMFRRVSPYSVRQPVQAAKLKLPAFPTTTVGSFPQTKEVRAVRAHLKKGEWTAQQYDEYIRQEVEKCVRIQESIGIDVPVHGEFERNDMVEFFGEQLAGYVFTENGWVQSCGSRCVKPPIIFGDVARPNPMTVEMSKYAQSLTNLPMKGMLTGPITCLQWSFVRDDQPRSITAFQLALALRDEVVDLEAAGIPVIQIDEPALREGLPLRMSAWEDYLDWAVRAFLLSSTGVRDETQIHTHMCYSDFNDIFGAIKALDTDVISIESSKSDLKLLKAFEEQGYDRQIGPGLYDIHSPRVPTIDEMKIRLQAYLRHLAPEQVWVNPDCGLKTRGWPEVQAALRNMVQVAIELRAQYAA